MIAQIRAELLKIRSTRTALGLILAMIALILPPTHSWACESITWSRQAPARSR